MSDREQRTEEQEAASAARIMARALTTCGMARPAELLLRLVALLEKRAGENIGDQWENLRNNWRLQTDDGRVSPVRLTKENRCCGLTIIMANVYHFGAEFSGKGEDEAEAIAVLRAHVNRCRGNTARIVAPGETL